MKTFGKRVKELREAKDLSLREFAKRLGGLSAAFLSDIELNRRYPSERVLAHMARVLDTTVEDLKKYDTRTPVEDLKGLTSSDPAFGFALRKLVDKDVKPDDLIKFLDRHPNRRKQA